MREGGRLGTVSKKIWSILALCLDLVHNSHLNAQDRHSRALLSYFPPHEDITSGMKSRARKWGGLSQTKRAEPLRVDSCRCLWGSPVEDPGTTMQHQAVFHIKHLEAADSYENQCISPHSLHRPIHSHIAGQGRSARKHPWSCSQSEKSKYVLSMRPPL